MSGLVSGKLLLRQELETLTDGSDADALHTHPAIGATEFWLDANSLSNSASGATLTFQSKGPYWALGPTTTDSVVGSILIPSDWATLDVDVWWFNTNTNSGNVKWGMYGAAVADTESMNTLGDIEFNATIAAGSQWIIKVSSFATSVAVSGADMYKIWLFREGGDVSDTLNADNVGVLGVVFTKAS